MKLSHLKTSQLIGLYNLALPAGATQLKKFSTKGVAERRTEIMIGAEGVPTDEIVRAAVVKLILSPAEADKILHPAFFQPIKELLAAAEVPELELGAAQGISINRSKAVTPPPASSPATVAATPIKAPAVKKQAKVPKAPKEKKKQKPSPHLNLRCEVCAYYAKTTTEMHAKARLVCPVDAKHGKLKTAEERGEKRGR